MEWVDFCLFGADIEAFTKFQLQLKAVVKKTEHRVINFEKASALSPQKLLWIGVDFCLFGADIEAFTKFQLQLKAVVKKNRAQSYKF